MLTKVSGWVGNFHPTHFPYRRFLLALAIGIAGGLVFSFLKLPLPWMLGPMLFSAVAAVFGAPVAAPMAVRSPMVVILGVLLGASVTPELVQRAPDYLISLSGLALVLAVATWGCYVWYRLAAGYDRTTAYYSAVPGGITEMILLGEADGGNPRTIAVVHSARIMFVIFVIPFLMQIITGVSIGTRPMPGIPLLALPLVDITLFFLTCVLGAWLGGFFASPLAMFVGPMIVSAIIHGMGWSSFGAPSELVIGAQLIIGLTLGCRFAGTKLFEIWKPMLFAFGACLIVLGIGLVVAYGVMQLGGGDLLTLMLAYAPGGVAEMSLVALALHLDPAIVALHHLARLLMVVASARAILKFLHLRATRD